MTFFWNAYYLLGCVCCFELEIPFVLVVLLYTAEVVIVEHTDEYDQKHSNEYESSFLSSFFKLKGAMIDLILFLFIDSMLF